MRRPREFVHISFSDDDAPLAPRAGVDFVAPIVAEGSYVMGTTGSADYPTTPGAFDTTHNGLGDVFVTKLNAAGSGLVYSTFLGGTNRDQGQGIVVRFGRAYVTGQTESTDYPTTPGAFDTTFNGGDLDALVTKLPTG